MKMLWLAGHHMAMIVHSWMGVLLMRVMPEVVWVHRLRRRQRALTHYRRRAHLAMRVY